MDRISELPQGILQTIMYFLSQKEAVRTSVLSKSWRNVWCTRPNLDFSFDSFDGIKQEFPSVVDNTLQRYFDQKLCLPLKELNLHISYTDNYSEHRTVWLLDKWIPLLTIMGVKDFRLSITSETRFQNFISLPDVVFQAESLKDLYVKKFSLSTNNQILFKQLKKLHLDECYIAGEMLDEIISSCPMIETMRLQRCQGLLADIKVNGLHNLKDLYFDDYFSDTSSIEIDDPSSLETVKILYGNIVWFRKADFCNLNYLSLRGVSSSFEHFSSCKFPNLKTLILNSCDGLKQSSHLFINAPSILYFEYNYELGFVPSISFANNSNEWESYITVPYWPSSSLHGLFDIIQLLESLSDQSKIFLTLSRCCSKVHLPDRFRVAYNGGCNKPVVVESLKLTYCEKFSYFSSLVLDIFRTCRPRNIYLYY